MALINHNSLSRSSSRPGLTLVEVLATIFILAIGMVSILVLFPVGAMKVKQALINERIALCAANGNSNLAVLNQSGIITDAKVAPNYSSTPDGNRITLIDQCAAASASSKYPLGSANALNVFSASVFPPGLTANQFKKIWFFLQDDVEWDNTGSTGGAFARGSGFSFAYLIRKNTTTPTPLFELTVLVYHGRSPVLYDSENDLPLNLAAMNDANNIGDLAIAVKTMPSKEDGRTMAKGSWIVDTTNMEFEFYQVQTVSEGKDTSGTTCFRLELDRPLLAKYGSAPTNGNVYWADYLSGVFPRGKIKFD